MEEQNRAPLEPRLSLGEWNAYPLLLISRRVKLNPRRHPLCGLFSQHGKVMDRISAYSSPILSFIG